MRNSDAAWATLVILAVIMACLMVALLTGCGTRFDPSAKPDTRILDYYLTHKCHTVPGQFNDVCVPA